MRYKFERSKYRRDWWNISRTDGVGKDDIGHIEGNVFFASGGSVVFIKEDFDVLTSMINHINDHKTRDVVVVEATKRENGETLVVTIPA